MCDLDTPSESPIWADPDLVSFNPRVEVVLPSSLDSSGFLGGGACPPPASITVAGTSFTLSFAPLCSVLAITGYFVLALAGLLAARIVIGAF